MHALVRVKRRPSEGESITFLKFRGDAARTIHCTLRNGVEREFDRREGGWTAKSPSDWEKGHVKAKRKKNMMGDRGDLKELRGRAVKTLSSRQKKCVEKKGEDIQCCWSGGSHGCI